MSLCKLLIVVGIACAAETDDYRIALLSSSLPQHQPALAEDLRNTLVRRGREPATIDLESLSSGALGRAGYDLLILPTCASLPLESRRAIEGFLAGGGDLLALGAPAFTDPLWRSGDRWYSKKGWRELLVRQRTTHLLFDFERTDLGNWQRHSNTPKSPVHRNLVDGPHGKALELRVENLQGWETLASPPLENPFPGDNRLMCLHARGSRQTRLLSLEWREKDGSRWIAVVPVSEKWRRVVLAPEDFKFWTSVPNRGRRGDIFKPSNAVQLIVGVAWSHTGPRGGEYQFAVDEIGTAPGPLGGPPEGLGAPPPAIEGLSPAYKFYELADVARVTTRFPWMSRGEIPLPAGRLLAHHPRPTGKGSGKGRGWRWVPLLEAHGPGGEWRGAPACLYLDCDGPGRASVRTTFSVEDPVWYRKPQVLDLIGSTVERLAGGVFIEEAGSDLFTYSPGQPAELGARVVNTSRREARGMELHFTMKPLEAAHETVEIVENIDVPPGTTKAFKTKLRLDEGVSRWRLVARLLGGGEILDAVTHEVAVARPKPVEKRQFVTAREGDFYLGDRKWYVHGVNYMPSTGIAIEDRGYFEYWLGARSYDPEFVHRDLGRCRKMGFNAVSIFIYRRSLEAGNLLDILRRCEEHGLKVNLSIRPGTPMDYRREWWEDILRYNRLWENDTIFAYDIAWEPFFGTAEQRRRYDTEWRRWVEKRYGSLEEAERAWGIPAPRHRGRLSTPRAAHLGRDGAHRKMVADYRQFVDELVHERYQDAARRIRALDPNHLVSFRMTVTGDPTFDGSRRMPYDFRGVARSMDFLAPEGYGRIGDWEKVKPGLFTVAYARCCAPGKPVLWAEAGTSVWDQQNMRVDPGRLEFQAEYYEDFYRMVLQSHSNGVVWWWYPGGYRQNERSDFGILNPDGTDRPVTAVIRRFAAETLTARTIPAPEVLIEIDREGDARGLFGVYERVKERFWAAVDSGRNPGLVERRRSR